MPFQKVDCGGQRYRDKFFKKHTAKLRPYLEEGIPNCCRADNSGSSSFFRKTERPGQSEASHTKEGLNVAFCRMDFL